MSQERTQESLKTSVRLTLFGVEYDLDLEACRAAAVERAVELRAELGSEASSRELIAQAAGVNRKTLQRFLAGEGRFHVDTLADIVTRGLKLNVSDVLTRVSPSGDPEAVPA